MKSIIIGTAGHIDHGKTSLIKVLTGTNTDRLKEEQKRGITIDLGFAYLDLPGDTRAGIVDVPGHERFVRNMLAGIGGVDIVMLVVAADEGMMPQTREHLEILKLLNIPAGVVILTKTDLVEDGWVDLVTEELRAELDGTFLEEAPIIPFSAQTGAGKEDIIEVLAQLADSIPEKDLSIRSRMPIDRVFVLDGIGTVVTGTLVEGTIRVGDALEVFPSHLQTKVKSLQLHGNQVNEAHAGQRVAINVTGLHKSELHRGNVLAPPGSMHTTNILDGRLKLLPGMERSFTNRSRVRFHHGTSEIIGRMVLLGNEELKAGDEAFVQLLLESEVPLRAGDSFVLRNFSPVYTIGGGQIVDANPKKHKRFKEEVLDGLSKLETGDAENALEMAVLARSAHFERLSKFALPIGLSNPKAVLKPLLDTGLLLALSDDPDPILVHREFFDRLVEESVELLKTHHAKAPLEEGMKKEELRSRVLKKLGVTTEIDHIRIPLRNLEQRLVASKIIDERGECFALRGFRVEVKGAEAELQESILKAFEVPGVPYEVLKPYKNPQPVFQMLLKNNKLVRLNDEMSMERASLLRAIDQIKAAILASETKNIALGAARDVLGMSRKQALAILEYMDRMRITKKIDDARVLC